MKLPPRRAGERGSATAELAVLFPVLLLLLGFLLFSAQTAVAQMRLEDAARAAAREAARGAAAEAVDSVARRLGGADANVVVRREGGFLEVEVGSRLAGPFGDLLGNQLKAKATTRAEDSEAPGAMP
ncbi:TadE family type IV pilus minor pilin [Arthrobacter russicus]|jgi:hypothetical protein|uniref:TadE-like domain-containing protein n=1 Tax=Arthrobacter russicus TaxID=172040 RepID=A0ABU1JE66_9MICC|nr:TadE family type IV pilus minor pilin [Arthrobacter russicus]MDR6270166.1 hypothetical protein [Arthrobacter russicus]